MSVSAKVYLNIASKRDSHIHGSSKNKYRIANYVFIICSKYYSITSYTEVMVR